MSFYILGIILAIVTAALHAGSNILDGFFSVKIFDRLANLIFFSCLINLLILPVIFIWDKPQILSLSLFGVIIIVSLINVIYQYPYYWSLQKTDTSVVISLFSLGKIFTPLLAFIIVNEHLEKAQYAGFFVIICASVLLTLDFKNLRFSPVFMLMLFVSIMLTVQEVLFKYLFNNGVSWSTIIFWTAIAEVVISAIFIFFPKNFSDLKNSSRKVKEHGLLFVLNQALNWGGEILGLYALIFIPVSVFEGISDVQPVFVLIFAILFAKKNSEIFNEYIGKEGVVKKILIFVMMILGALLII
ncbi:MAG TPA: EamA family transporter [Bacteroidia bacterium]